MIKLNNAHILIAEESLNLFITAPLPIDVAFKMKKILQEYNPKLITAKTKRLELFQKYGEKTSDGFQILEEHKEEFDKEIQSLVEEQVELNVEPCKTKTSWLPTSLHLSPEQLSILEPFLLLE
jgi:hypothetical protein